MKKLINEITMKAKYLGQYEDCTSHFLDEYHVVLTRGERILDTKVDVLLMGDLTVTAVLDQLLIKDNDEILVLFDENELAQLSNEIQA